MAKCPSDLDIVIASPRNTRLNVSQTDFDFDSQIDWETKHLNLAAKSGIILFWLSNELIHFCNRAFAQTTRFELGEWLAKSSREQRNSSVHISLENTVECAISGLSQLYGTKK